MDAWRQLACHGPSLQHLGRRLRQLEGVSGRGLLTRGSTACGTAPHYVTISLRGPASGTQGDPEAWQLVYRSEAVCFRGRCVCAV